MAVEYRLRNYDDIISANINDQQLLYSLIRTQRKGKGPSKLEINFGNMNVPVTTSKCNKWAKYYKDLATPQNQPFYEKYAKLKRLIFATLPEEPPLKISKAKVLTDIMSLKNNKTADIFGISAEHLKYANLE